MTTEKQFKLGQRVKYSNGGLSIYEGIIVAINPNRIIVVDDNSSMILWNAGYAVGSCIKISQIK